MCGAGTVLGKTLIGTADEIQCFFSLGVGAIQHAQGMTAFVAENQALQQKIIGTASGAFAAVHQHPHLAETLSVNQRLMGIFNHNPIITILMQTLLRLVADLHLPPLHHIADVGLILQHIGNTLAAPQPRIGSFATHVPAAVGGRCRDALLVQRSGNLAAANAVQRHGKDPPHYGRNLLINDDLVLFGRVHFVAIYRFAADKLPLALLIPLDGLDLLGNVLGVHVVHNGAEGRNIIGAGLHASVDAVQEGNVAHPMLREVPLHVVTGHDVVTSQTAQVLGNDHVDLFGLNIADHSLKIRAVKVGAAPAIVNVGVINL